jgi:predicted PurR-regulated permease PerM
MLGDPTSGEDDAKPIPTPFVAPAPTALMGGRMPRWVPRAVILFWLGYLAMLLTRFTLARLRGLLILLLVSLFLSFAIEPGVNRLVRRGWRRGRATAAILFAVLIGVALFFTAIGTLVATQVADLAQNSERYVNRTVDFLNDNFNTNIDPADVNKEINDPDGSVQKFIKSQQDEALQLSVAVLGVLLQLFGGFFFTFYLVADGPRMRRAICSRLVPDRQRQVLDTWDLAIQKTGGYLYSRMLLALLSAFAHWVLLQAVGAPAAVALALWVGLVSQFIPVVGTYIAGALPILLVFIDSPVKALIVVIFIVVYQQVENYLFAPRITARTMEIHPAVAFGSALGGAALLGGVGAILALPTAAMFQALASSWGQRHEVLDDPLTTVAAKRKRERKRKQEKALETGDFAADDSENDADGG